MTKDFLLPLTEEHYGAGAFHVYGRLLEEQQLTRDLGQNSREALAE